MKSIILISNLKTFLNLVSGLHKKKYFVMEKKKPAYSSEENMKIEVKQEPCWEDRTLAVTETAVNENVPSVIQRSELPNLELSGTSNSLSAKHNMDIPKQIKQETYSLETAEEVKCGAEDSGVQHLEDADVKLDTKIEIHEEPLWEDAVLVKTKDEPESTTSSDSVTENNSKECGLMHLGLEEELQSPISSRLDAEEAHSCRKSSSVKQDQNVIWIKPFHIFKLEDVRHKVNEVSHEKTTFNSTAEDRLDSGVTGSIGKQQCRIKLTELVPILKLEDVQETVNETASKNARFNSINGTTRYKLDSKDGDIGGTSSSVKNQCSLKLTQLVPVVRLEDIGNIVNQSSHKNTKYNLINKHSGGTSSSVNNHKTIKVTELMPIVRLEEVWNIASETSTKSTNYNPANKDTEEEHNGGTRTSVKTRHSLKPTELVPTVRLQDVRNMAIETSHKSTNYNPANKNTEKAHNDGTRASMKTRHSLKQTEFVSTVRLQDVCNMASETSNKSTNYNPANKNTVKAHNDGTRASVKTRHNLKQTEFVSTVRLEEVRNMASEISNKSKNYNPANKDTEEKHNGGTRTSVKTRHSLKPMELVPTVRLQDVRNMAIETSHKSTNYNPANKNTEEEHNDGTRASMKTRHSLKQTEFVSTVRLQDVCNMASETSNKSTTYNPANKNTEEKHNGGTRTSVKTRHSLKPTELVPIVRLEEVRNMASETSNKSTTYNPANKNTEEEHNGGTRTSVKTRHSLKPTELVPIVRLEEVRNMASETSNKSTTYNPANKNTEEEHNDGTRTSVKTRHSLKPTELVPIVRLEEVRNMAIETSHKSTNYNPVNKNTEEEHNGGTRTSVKTRHSLKPTELVPIVRLEEVRNMASETSNKSTTYNPVNKNTEEKHNDGTRTSVKTRHSLKQTEFVSTVRLQDICNMASETSNKSTNYNPTNKNTEEEHNYGTKTSVKTRHSLKRTELVPTVRLEEVRNMASETSNKSTNYNPANKNTEEEHNDGTRTSVKIRHSLKQTELVPTVRLEEVRNMAIETSHKSTNYNSTNRNTEEEHNYGTRTSVKTQHSLKPTELVPTVRLEEVRNMAFETSHKSTNYNPANKITEEKHNDGTRLSVKEQHTLKGTQLVPIVTLKDVCNRFNVTSHKNIKLNHINGTTRCRLDTEEEHSDGTRVSVNKQCGLKPSELVPTVRLQDVRNIANETSHKARNYNAANKDTEEAHSDGTRTSVSTQFSLESTEIVPTIRLEVRNIVNETSHKNMRCELINGGTKEAHSGEIISSVKEKHSLKPTVLVPTVRLKVQNIANETSNKDTNYNPNNKDTEEAHNDETRTSVKTRHSLKPTEFVSTVRLKDVRNIASEISHKSTKYNPIIGDIEEVQSGRTSASVKEQHSAKPTELFPTVRVEGIPGVVNETSHKSTKFNPINGDIEDVHSLGTSASVKETQLVPIVRLEDVRNRFNGNSHKNIKYNPINSTIRCRLDTEEAHRGGSSSSVNKQHSLKSYELVPIVRLADIRNLVEEASPKSTKYNSINSDAEEANSDKASSSMKRQHGLKPAELVPIIRLEDIQNITNKASCTNVEINSINDTVPHGSKFCGKTFVSAFKLKEHSLIHKEKFPFKCQICDKAFVEVQSLKRHKFIHSRYKIFKCKLCKKSFPSKLKLKQHGVTHCASKPYQCKKCWKIFTRLSSFKIHKQIHRGIKPYQCNICGENFRKPSLLKRHAVIHRHINTHKYKNSPISVLKLCKQIHTSIKSCKCKLCGKKFPKQSMLQAHRLSHSRVKPHKCKICFKRFFLLSNLRIHSLSHKGVKPYKCELCGKSYAYMSQLNVHRDQVHNIIRPYKCDTCEKRFFYMAYLKMHKRIHNNVQEYKCETCGETFAYFCALKKHRLAHSHPYKCKVCGKRFSYESDLKKHEPIHQEDKAHKCDICGKEFLRNSQLVFHMRKKHMLLHKSRRYNCDICSSSFSLKSALKRHIFNHEDRKL